MKFRILLAILLCLLLVGCSPVPKDYSKDITALTANLKTVNDNLTKVTTTTTATISQQAATIASLNAKVDALTKQVAGLPTKADLTAASPGFTAADATDIRKRLSAIEGQALNYSSRQATLETRVNGYLSEYDKMITEKYGNLSTQFANKYEIMMLQNQVTDLSNRLILIEQKLGLR